MENKYNFIEAYCLMLYKCSKCGNMEIVWNSRDGVTPFCIPCDICKCYPTIAMNHIAWELDTKHEEYKPHEGMKIFTGPHNEPKTERYKNKA